MEKLLNPKIICDYDEKGNLVKQEYEYTFNLKVDEVVTYCGDCPFFGISGYEEVERCHAPKCLFGLFDDEQHWHLNMEYYCDKERD